MHIVVATCACLVLAIVLSGRVASASEEVYASASVDPIAQPDAYSAVLYDNTNGLPTSEANDIAQTSEGFIWIGSYGGLIRYDGNTFERMYSNAGIGSVACLHVDEEDRLWIGTNDSGLAMLDHGQLHFWNVADGLGSPKITAINEDANGTIYVGTSAGIAMVSSDLTLQSASDHRLGTAYIDRISQGTDGLIYCVTNSDDYFAMRRGRLVEYLDHSVTTIQGMTCIYADHDHPGEMYVGTETTTLYHGNPKRAATEMEAIDISPLNSVFEITKVGDKLWLCAANGIGVLDDTGFHHLEELPLYSSVRHLMVDHEGYLWFASSRQGVMKLVPNQFTDVFARYDLPEAVVNSTCMLDGRLFIGTDSGLLVVDREAQVDSVPLASAQTASGEDLGSRDLIELLDGLRIRSIIRDSRDRLWIATWRGIGMVRYDHGDVMTFTESDGLFSDHVRTSCETADGSMLVACTGGMCVIEGDRITARYGRDEGITNVETLTVCAAPNGDYLMGTDGSGLYVVNADGVHGVGVEDGLTSGIVMRIKYDQAKHVFWIVTSNSLAYLDEHYQVTTVDDFPYSNNFDLYASSNGNMWVLSSDGIYVVPTEELILNDGLDYVHYGIANGLPCIATSNSYSEVTEEGFLYLAGNTGVARVNIESALDTLSDIRQCVPYIEANGTQYYPDESGTFHIPSSARRLTIYPHVFNYSLADPQVSYYLEGFDQELVTVRRSTLGPLTYTNLPGGSYRFYMELRGSFGHEDRTLSVPIVKEKALYEELWFHVLAFLFAGAVIALTVRSYIRRKVRALEEKHRQEAERERIANELQMANEIQSSMLPHIFPPYPDRNEFDLYASMNPAREVGGDFYDFYLIDDDHLCLVIADVSGKGIPAALFMMISKVVLQGFANLKQSAADILTRANDMLYTDNQTDMFVTVWLGILEISSGKLVAVNAGHEYPAIRRAGGKFELLKDKHGLMAGIMENIRYREYELWLSPGDQLFVYTDGVPEATDAEDRMFGTDRMLDALNEQDDATPEELLRHVREAVDAFVQGAEQYDDLTMLGIEYRGSQIPS